MGPVGGLRPAASASARWRFAGRARSLVMRRPNNSPRASRSSSQPDYPSVHHARNMRREIIATWESQAEGDTWHSMRGGRADHDAGRPHPIFPQTHCDLDGSSPMGSRSWGRRRCPWGKLAQHSTFAAGVWHTYKMEQGEPSKCLASDSVAD